MRWIYFISILILNFGGVLLNPSLIETSTAKDCGSEIGEIKTIVMSNCDLNETCRACNNSSRDQLRIRISFTLNENVKLVKHEGYFQATSTPYNQFSVPVEDQNVCSFPNKYGLKCPLNKKDAPFTYFTTINLKKFKPSKFNVTLFWILRNEKNQTIICIEIPTVIL